MIHLTAIGLTPVGNSTAHFYTQTIHRTTQLNSIHKTEHTQEYINITTKIHNLQNKTEAYKTYNDIYNGKKWNQENMIDETAIKQQTSL
jgi:hypothetical protein